MKIDHIGYLCKNIQRSKEQFLTLGYQMVSEIVEDNVPLEDGNIRNVSICFLEKDGYRIELVSPLNQDSVVYQTLKKNGEGPYHICYQTENLISTITELEAQGYFLIQEPASAIAFENAKVAFLYQAGIGILELVEK